MPLSLIKQIKKIKISSYSQSLNEGSSVNVFICNKTNISKI